MIDRLNNSMLSKGVGGGVTHLGNFPYCLVVAAVFGFASSHALSDFSQQPVPIIVTGEGINPEDARHAAMRAALEQGGAVEIASYSKVENFQLIRDTIIARADSVISDFKVLEEGPSAGGLFFCKIQAVVNPSAIASTWGEVQILLEQIGRPGIMVMIRESIDNVVDDSSILAARLQERLIKSGFDVYSFEHFTETQRRAAQVASENNDLSKLQMLAQEFGAEIFIRGTAHANAAGIEHPYGATLAMYNGDCAVDVFYTDTARLITSESLPNWRGGARGHSEISKQAGKTALSNAAEEIVNRLYESCMKSWATQITAGGEIQFEVSGVDFKMANDIKKSLESLGNSVVVSVNGPKLTAGIATFKIVARVNAQTLAEHLIQGDWPNLIEITDLKLNRIQAKRVAIQR